MNHQEFNERVLPVSSRLYQLARRLLGNEHDAEDVVQEIFLKLWDMRTQLVTIRSIEAFSFRMTRNLCLDKLKRMQPHYFDDREQGAYRYEEADETPDPEGSLVLKDTVEKVNRMIGNLPEQQRTLMQLRDIEGMEYEEISDITGLEINAIRVGISRARKKLRDHIYKNQYDERPGPYS